MVKKIIFNPLTHGITLLIFIFILFDNPFSSFTGNDNVEYYKPLKKDKIVYKKGAQGEIYNDIKNDRYIYIYSQSKMGFSVGKVLDNTNTGRYTLQIQDIRSSNVHPLPTFTRHPNGDLLILGTLPSPNESDFLSVIVANGYNTLKLVTIALLSFLISGIVFGIILGYYRQGLNKILKYLRIGDIFDIFIKIFESTPLLLWILLTVIMLELYAPGLSDANTCRLTFMFFGFFSSTALTKLISDKIQDLNSEEFITALKLQGIPNYKIIFNHIIRYFCLPIIGYQASYIIAQSYFLDISLNVIKFGFIGTWGKQIHSLIDSGQLTSDNISGQFHLITMVIIIFSTIYVFYNLANYFEKVANN